MTEFKALIGKIATGATLTIEESTRAFELMMTGEATPSQMGALLMAMRLRGETLDEITGAVKTLRSKMLPVAAPLGAMDILGTGGDCSNSYNISTCTAFVVAGAGVPVAKQGGRAVSSQCGAADVLTALGVRIDLAPDVIAQCIAEAGIGFMFAPSHHPATKHAASTRVELGTRTIFNLLGPLSNPAGVRRHLIGVYSRQLVEPVAQVLHRFGSERAFVVHGSDGLDEITLTGSTTIASLENGLVHTFEVTPEDVGLSQGCSEGLKGGDASTNAAALRAVLSGEKSAYRDATTFNAAAALVVGGRAKNLRDGIEIAAKSIDSGEATRRLDQLIKISNA